MTHPSSSVAGILLTGGNSQRMGRDKSQLIIDGATLATRTAGILLSVVEVAIEVGPGVSGLPATREDPPGQGPLAAIVAGHRKLHDLGHEGAALVVACDLPFLSAPLLHWLIEWNSPNSVVPMVHGRAQPLCARWQPHDLAEASEQFARGIRSLQQLVDGPGVNLLGESQWGDVARAESFSDVDSPDDLERLGLQHLFTAVSPLQ